MLAGRFFAYVSIAELGVHTVQLSAIRLDVGIDEEIERLPLLARRDDVVFTVLWASRRRGGVTGFSR